MSLESRQSGADAVNWVEGNSNRTELAGCGCFAGVGEQGMHARVTLEPGRAQPFLVADAVRAPRKKRPGTPSEAVQPTAANWTTDKVAPSEGNDVRRDGG
ncbi:hypothetical protein [Thiocapsa sp.]|uniref:hypothetical protein n=1 Tax=Thiocapsa sp. TaxID=2024551 RepID=UPI00359492A3